jgi:L-cysteine desulfidase
MKVILDIKDNRVPFFMELVKNLDFISIVKEVKDKAKSEAIQDLAEAFNDVKLYEEGKKKLKSAKHLYESETRIKLKDETPYSRTIFPSRRR